MSYRAYASHQADCDYYPAFGTDGEPVSDYRMLDFACERAAERNLDLTYEIFDETGEPCGIHGWMWREQLSAIDDEEVREQARREATPPALLYTMSGLAADLSGQSRRWLALQQLKADRGYYGGVHVGLPALGYRLAAPVLVAALDRLAERLNKKARPFITATAAPDARRRFADVQASEDVAF